MALPLRPALARHVVARLACPCHALSRRTHAHAPLVSEGILLPLRVDVQSQLGCGCRRTLTANGRPPRSVPLVALTAAAAPVAVSAAGASASAGHCRRGACCSAYGAAGESAAGGSFREAPAAPPLGLLGGFLRAILTRYLNANPTARKCLWMVQQAQPDTPLVFDHVAFRSFGTHGCGVDAVTQFFTDFGYVPKDELIFPAKRLRAVWLAPPPSPPPAASALALANAGGTAQAESPSAHLRLLRCVDGPLPRVFVSQLQVELLSSACQAIIRRHTAVAEAAARHAFALSALQPRPWPVPSLHDFHTLAEESEYAAWTLVNGFALNHTTVSVHRLDPTSRILQNSVLTSADTHAGVVATTDAVSARTSIHNLNHALRREEVELNMQGGEVKASPDGLLLQSSTAADTAPYAFSDGLVANVPLSYLEFAQRLVLPQFLHLSPSEIAEVHRREGFEVGNADKIFESTSIRR